METACKVYAKLMLQRGHGYPLWEPEPNEAGEVLIGDVGYILHGGFYRLFNATLPANDPVNQRCGTPDGYERFDYPDALLHRRPRALEPRPLCSKNVVAFEMEASADVGVGTPGLSGGLRFKCSDEQAAILVLKHPGDRETLHPCRDLTQYIIKHHHEWYIFARDVCRLEIEEDSIIFVGGFIKTAEWALVAATHRAREGELFFGGEFGPLTKATFSVSTSRETMMSFEHRTGPHHLSDAGSPSYDQCVFLHYYKLKRRRLLSPKVIQAAGEQHGSPLPSPPSSPPPSPGLRPTRTESESLGSGEEVTLESIPPSEEPMDPLDGLLDYILLQDGIEIALASEQDLEALFSGDFIPSDIPHFLRTHKPRTFLIDQRVGVVSILHDSDFPTEAQARVTPMMSSAPLASRTYVPRPTLPLTLAQLPRKLARSRTRFNHSRSRSGSTR